LQNVLDKTFEKLFYKSMNNIQKIKKIQYLLRFLWILGIAGSTMMTACLPIPATNYPTNNVAENKKILLFENHVYEPHIRTIQLNTQGTGQAEQGLVSLQQSKPVFLSFDAIQSEGEDFRAKIIHCDQNWKASTLNVIEYLNDFNEFYLRDYEPSFNTRVPYIRYQWQLPKLKISGNYLLKIYRDSDEDDLILTYRLIVYENLVAISPKVFFSNVLEERNQKQQIEFELDYQGFQILNPQLDLHVVLRQNQRWDNAIIDLKPLNVRDFLKKIDYRAFDGENTFSGGNEFRRFEVKSTRFLGFNVSSIRATDTSNVATLELDESRANRPYTKQPDLNGFYEIDRYESQSQNETEADYVKVTFRLKSEFLGEAEKVYVIGAFNLWTFTSENQMTYIAESSEYQTDILLKQGGYNYLYATQEGNQKGSLDTFEGNFQATENLYDIIVYYRPAGQRYDQVIGFRSFNSSQAR